MVLEGSCHCGAVTFSLRSSTPYPYMACYCSICRKTAGGGGFAVNIMGEAGSLEVRGRETVSVYRARRASENGGSGDGLSSARRHFCARCGSALWAFDPSWPELVHPFASAIDTPAAACFGTGPLHGRIGGRVGRGAVGRRTFGVRRISGRFHRGLASGEGTDRGLREWTVKWARTTKTGRRLRGRFEARPATPASGARLSSHTPSPSRRWRSRFRP